MPREEVLGSREESRLFPLPGQCAGVAEMPARLGRWVQEGPESREGSGQKPCVPPGFPAGAGSPRAWGLFALLPSSRAAQQPQSVGTALPHLWEEPSGARLLPLCQARGLCVPGVLCNRPDLPKC